jgi:hypothetical protein
LPHSSQSPQFSTIASIPSSDQTTGADLPKVSEENGIGSVTYERADDDGFDWSAPQQEAEGIARFDDPQQSRRLNPTALKRKTKK